MAKLTAKQLRQRNNELAAGYFAVAMLGMMVVFTIIHQLDRLLQRPAAKKSNSKFVFLFSSVRSLLLRKVPGFSSVGHLIVFMIYFAINIALCFREVDYSSLTGISKRTGWIAASNLCLITFLALKNTPLAFLTAYSYERLNILHQAAGYCTIGWALLHGVLYTTAWSYSDNLHELELVENVMGVVAGLSMLIILLSAILIRKMRYELFYVIHITMFILIVIGVGMHRPKITTKTAYLAIFTGAIWALDRWLRISRVLFNFVSNTATITALPHDGVRVIVRKTPWRAVPGSHVFLWLPSIRGVETHPFTIVSTNPLELVVSACDGFTKDLLHMASKEDISKDIVLRTSVDGPYGALPDWMSFDKIILVAGGSGASFTVGVANSILERVSKLSDKKQAPIVHFIWAIREKEQISWFSTHLAALQASPHVTLSIHVTRHSPESTKAASLVENEKEAISSNAATPPSKTPAIFDMEKSLASSSSSNMPLDVEVQGGRPQIAFTLKTLINNTVEPEKVIIGACGPEGLMREVRSTVAGEVTNGTKSVRLHCETFGW